MVAARLVVKAWRKKRTFAILLITVLLLLFGFSDSIERWMYPIKYKEAIARSAERYDTDPYLVAAIIRVESNYKPDVVSSKQASGLMQLLPETSLWAAEEIAKTYGDQVDGTVPSDNLVLGSWYLHSLSGTFEEELAGAAEMDRVALLAAAYNGGPGNVGKWLNGVWDGTYANIDQIPFGETRHYVRRVIYYYNKYKDVYGDQAFVRAS